MGRPLLRIRSPAAPSGCHLDLFSLLRRRIAEAQRGTVTSWRPSSAHRPRRARRPLRATVAPSGSMRRRGLMARLERDRGEADRDGGPRQARAQVTPAQRSGPRLDPSSIVSPQDPARGLVLQRLVSNTTVVGLTAERATTGASSDIVQRSARLHIGHLSSSATSESIESTSAEVGEVREESMPADRETGQPRGVAFVTVGNDPAASEATTQLNGSVLDGRPIRVNEAQARVSAARGGGGGFGGRGGGGGGRGGGRDSY